MKTQTKAPGLGGTGREDEHDDVLAADCSTTARAAGA